MLSATASKLYFCSSSFEEGRDSFLASFSIWSRSSGVISSQLSSGRIKDVCITLHRSVSPHAQDRQLRVLLAFCSLFLHYKMFMLLLDNTGYKAVRGWEERSDFILLLLKPCFICSFKLADVVLVTDNPSATKWRMKRLMQQSTNPAFSWICVLRHLSEIQMRPVLHTGNNDISAKKKKIYLFLHKVYDGLILAVRVDQIEVNFVSLILEPVYD